MTSSIRQTATFDPTPSNIGGIAGTPSHFPCAFPLATLAGSTIVVLACIANQVGNTVTGVSDSNALGTPYTSVKHLSSGVGGLDTGLYCKQNAASIPAGDYGTSTGGSSTTLVDSSKSWTTNQWVGATFINNSNGATSTVTSNTATTLTFGSTIASSSGQVYTVGGYVDVQVSNFDDYNAIRMQEVTGVSASSLVGSAAAIQSSLAPGTNNIQTGTDTLGTNPVIIISFGINDNDSGSGTFNPLADTSATDDGTGWLWDLSSPIMRQQHQNLSNPGTRGAQFSAQTTPNDHYQSFMIALLDSTGGGGGSTQCSMGSDLWM